MIQSAHEGIKTLQIDVTAIVVASTAGGMCVDVRHGDATYIHRCKLCMQTTLPSDLICGAIGKLQDEEEPVSEW